MTTSEGRLLLERMREMRLRREAAAQAEIEANLARMRRGRWDPRWWVSWPYRIGAFVLKAAFVVLCILVLRAALREACATRC